MIWAPASDNGSVPGLAPMRTPSDHYGTALRLQPRARDCAFALLGLACAPAACASYGNMRLDGIAFALAVMLLYLWSILLGTAVGVGLCKRKLLVIVATAVTAAL